MKKWLVLLISVVMVLCMVTPSFAATAAEQVVYAGEIWYYDAAGEKVNNTTFPGGDAVIELSKTVASTGKENEFEVTLQVSTTQKIDELRSDTPDAAVMLVLDVSNSMDDCAECDGGRNHEDSHADRLAKAKEAAIKFWRTSLIRRNRAAVTPAGLPSWTMVPPRTPA